MRINDMDLMARVNYSAIRKEVHSIRSTPGYVERFNYFALGNLQLEDDGLEILQFKNRKEYTEPSGSVDYTHTRKKATSMKRFLKGFEDVLRWLALLVFIGISIAIVTTIWLIVAIGLIRLYLYMLWP